MDWFRSRSKLGAYLALFALALQLALTFGHVHLDRAAPISADRFAVATADASNAAQVKPTDPTDRHDRADDHCAICTLIHLAGTVVLAAPPSLPLPDISVRVPSEPPLAFDFPSPHRALFAARAPPTA